MAESFVHYVHQEIVKYRDSLLSRLDDVCQVDRLQGCLRIALSSLLSIVAISAQEIREKAPLGLVWEVNLAYETNYASEVEALFVAYESMLDAPLMPAERGRVGLKVNTRSGAGLSTPLPLLRAVIDALEARGYGRGDIVVVDDSAHNLREAGIMPSLSRAGRTGQRFEGTRVLALDSGAYYESEWFYDSPLPSSFQRSTAFALEESAQDALEEGAEGRKSYLPQPLLFEVDFWINLAVGVDDPALGIDGALANATLWNVSNSRRFLVNQATASAAVAEIAAIPELAERMVLNFVSLEAYQFIGGPRFNAIYTRSEPRLWMSSDPVALDRLLYDRINTMRRLEGFPEINPLPKQLPFAASLGLGVHERSRIRIEKLELVHPQPSRPTENREPPKFEQAPDWLKRLAPW